MLIVAVKVHIEKPRIKSETINLSTIKPDKEENKSGNKENKNCLKSNPFIGFIPFYPIKRPITRQVLYCSHKADPTTSYPAN